MAASPEENVTVWEGKVVIRGKKVIPRGETLLIRPGTTVLFDYVDSDGDGLGESGIFIAGAVTAAGTAEEPVVFAPLKGPLRPGLWDTIQIEEGGTSHLAGCRFTGARWALHVHLTDLLLEKSRFEGNEGGIRFRGGPMVIRGNVFRNNGTALRYWESAPEIVGNVISGNGTGIFSREGSAGSVITGNDFSGNRDYHVKLGELQEKDVAATGNWWGTGDGNRIGELIYDRADASYLGRVIYEPFAPAPLLPMPSAAGNTAPAGE
jgi:parallel beta-helix repeat protein